jgi:hypothetical protein
VCVGICLATAAAACSGGRWTRSERREVDAFTQSIRYAQDVTALSNARVRGEATFGDMAPLETAAQQALAASEQISDSVLSRLHPELPDQYRKLFVPALRMRLDSVRAAKSGKGTLEDQVKWQFHMNEWGNWYAAHVEELRGKLQ